MNLWTYNVREIQRRPGRMLLTLLGITVGLATVVATRLTIRTVDRAYRDLFEGVAGRPALEVSAKGQSGFDPASATGLEQIPGVQAVVPRIQSAAALVSASGSMAVPVLGIDPGGAAVADWPVSDGQALTGDDDALLDPGLAASLHLRPGQSLEIWSAAGSTHLRLSGRYQPRGASAATGGQMIVALACAQRLFNLPQHVNSIQVLLTDDADPAAVRAAIAQRLTADLIVQPPGMRGELARSTLLAAEQGLSALSLVALIASTFVILNTFLLNLGERRKQVAVLRALGASRRQVLQLLLREALLLGLFGAAAGCAGGFALAVGLNYLMQKFLGIMLPSMTLSAGPFVLAAVLGPGASVAAACLPAWRASGRPPLLELLPGRTHSEEVLPRWVWQLGLLFIALGIGLEIALGAGYFSDITSRNLLAPAVALLLVGGVLALPLIVVPLLRLLAALPLGLEGRFAVQQLARHRGRTSLTSGILFLALVVAIAFGQALRTTLRDLQHWYRQTIVADFLIRGAMPDSSFTLAPALPESLAESIGKCGDVTMDRISFLPAEVEDQQVLVLARTFAADRPLPLDLQEGDETSVRRGLMAGEVVLGTGLAQRLGLHRGNVLKLTTTQGVRELRVTGTAVEYAGGGLALYLEWETARKYFDSPGVHVFLVSNRDGDLTSLSSSLRGFCEQHHLLLQSNADLRSLIEGMLSRVSGALWGLMVLAFAVASLGIVNTLTMNVHDQTREFGVLRALGLKRGQVFKVVVAQAVLLASLSLVPGALAGAGMAYAIHRASAAWTGSPAPFQMDFLLIFGACVLAVVMAVLAALSPARQAVRLPVATAIQQ
ncbi:MAG: ABC transporter permease [Gemmataceae bacterium]